jgi:hypothetical protein
MAVVILTGVSTVITKGSLSSNGRRYIRKELHSKESLALTSEEGSLGTVAVEDSHDPTTARDS